MDGQQLCSYCYQRLLEGHIPLSLWLRRDLAVWTREAEGAQMSLHMPSLMVR